jgi:formylglycine-generating enzyme required for sulfatase activity
LFLAEAHDQAQPFLVLLRDLLNDDAPAVIAVFTIRSDNYERLQLAPELEGVHQDTLSLPPMPKGSYAEVIKGPARRLDGTESALDIEDALVNALLTDIDAGGAKDALPLLAFTLERLYGEYHSGGTLKLAHYDALGRVKGSIEAAVERALKAADADPAVPRDRVTRLVLLRRGLIPWLAGIDPDTGAPRRRVARLSEIPAEARPLIQHLIEQRLLATDVSKDTGEKTVEPAHEALLRQWGLLQDWLTEDAGLLAVLEGVKRASRDWAANAKNAAWLAHATDRLAAAERLSARPDLAAHLEPTDCAYLAECRKAEANAKRGKRLVLASMFTLLVGIIAGLVGWINQGYIKEQWRWWTVTRPYMMSQVRPHVLPVAKEQALRSGETFRECPPRQQDQDYCPDMIVVPAGSFAMGSSTTEKGREDWEGPQHTVTITNQFAVSRFELTFAEWDNCYHHGGCVEYPHDLGLRGQLPVMYVSWDDARQYVMWLSKMTGKPYRLLTEAEYEYATRAGTTTAYPWGDDIGRNNANCNRCGSQWDNTVAPVGTFTANGFVGSFAPNGFGLYQMLGNVWEWTEDCEHTNYIGAPTDGSAWLADNGGDCTRRIIRSGSWHTPPDQLRSAYRISEPSGIRDPSLGFRVARTLVAP